MTARRVTPLLLAACIACVPADGVQLPSAAPPIAPVLRVKVIESGRTRVRKVALEDYVHGAIVSEFAPPAGEAAVVERMYEVQAVVSRTYATANLARHVREGYDLCATTHCQLYEPSRLGVSRWTRAAAHAVQRTKGMVLWFEREPARAVFHADCGGHTSAAASVWIGRARPYLVALADEGPAATAHRSWRFEASARDLLRALNADPRTRVGNRLDTIVVIERDRGGRAERVALHGQRDLLVRGEDLREVLARALGPGSIRSTRFYVRRDGGMFAFDGTGFGHGVGLCQAGALARLEAGDTPRAVLLRYFPGTRLLKR